MINKKILSCILTLSLIFTSVNLVNIEASAAIPLDENIIVPEKLDKTDDPLYDPVFDYENSEWKTKYDSIVNSVSNCPEIDKLPKIDELVGYVPQSYLSLTQFRQVYGAGNDFILPTVALTIYITNASEIDLLAQLVNNTAENETAVEQGYYSTASYKLNTFIDYTGTTYVPIGNYTYPFNGTFDGDGYEINNIRLIDNVETQAIYSSYEYLGVFGYTGSNAVIRNLGITAMTLTAMYVLGGDAAFLCAQNHGLIENCYVNGKQTSVMTISNSTAGGICGENYGTIRGCYADAWIENDVTSGAYSEPQPIATVNHSENGAVVENCYYIKEAYKSLIIYNSRELLRDSKTATTNNANIFGWHYTGDESKINGIGLYYVDFITNLSSKTGSNFKNGLMQSEQGKYYGYGGLITLETVRNMVGTGSSFNSTYSNNTATSNYNTGSSVYGYNIAIRNSDEWNTYCKLVNGNMPNETAEEQDFWSHTTIAFYNPDNIETINGKRIEVIDLYADDEPLGTAEHPFYGVLSSGHKALVRYHLEAHRGGSYTPLVGYNAGSFRMDYVEIVGDNISQYIDKGILCDTNTLEFHVDQFVMDNSYRVTGNTNGVNVYATDPHYNELADMNYMNIALVRTDINNPNVGRLNIKSGFAYQWYSAEDTTTPAGYNYIPILYTTETQYRSYSYLSCKKQSSTEIEPALHYGGVTTTLAEYSYSKVNYASTTFTASSANSINYNYYIIPSIRAYPTLYAPDFVNNKYEVYSDKHLIWLTKYATGQDAVLMNTIDMGNYEFTGTPNVGWFNLDGTLVDTSDICNQIDLGVETPKCYGILNLKVNDTKLSTNGTSIGAKNNNINWSNVYFIGGYFKYGNYLKNNFYNVNDSRWLGNNLYNVHLSMDLIYNSRTSDSRDGSTASNSATLCSFSGNLVLNANNGGKVYPITYKANRCVNYANIVLRVDGNSYSATGFAYEAHDCVFRGTTEKLANYKVDTFIGIGGISAIGSRLKADGIYNFNSDTTFPIYLLTNGGNNTTVTNCVFSGTYRVKHTCGAKIGYILNCGSNIVCTPTSVFDGNVAVNSSNGECNNMIFLGTIDLYIVGGTYYMFETYSYNLLSYGTINIHRNPDDSKFVNIATSDKIYNAGITKSYNTSVSLYLTAWGGYNRTNVSSIFASQVNFDNDMQGYRFNDTKIYILEGGVCNLVNYSNIELNGNVFIDTLNLLSSYKNNTTMINYGNITCTGHSCFKFINIINNTYDGAISKNFGNVSLDWAYYTEIYCIQTSRLSDNISSDTANYGNITMNAIDSNGTLVAAVGLKNCKYGINYGDITVDYHNYSDIGTSDRRFAGSLGGGVNLGDITVSNMVDMTSTRDLTVCGAGNENYGKLKLKNISGSKSNIFIIPLFATLNNDRSYYDYIYNRLSKCDVVVDDCDFSNASLYYYDLYRQSNIEGNEYALLDANVNITNSTFKNLYVLQGITCSTSGTYNIQTLYSNSFNVRYTNGLITNIDNIGHTNIDTVNVTNICNYSGMVNNNVKDDIGYKHNNTTVLFKDCSLKDFTYSGISIIGNCTANRAEWINNSNFTMDNIELKSAAYIDGITSNRSSCTSNNSNKVEKQSIANAYNFSTMNIDVHGYPIYISGISSGSQVCTNANTSNNIVVNASTINVSNDKDIYICGIIRNDGAHTATSYVRNAINCGNITATKTGSGSNNVKIYGITDKASTVQSVENFGNISTNATSGEIAAICGDATNMCTGWVNYGSVSNPNFGSSDISTTVKTTNDTGILGFGINYGVFDKPLSSNKGEYHFLVDLSNNKKTIPNGNNTFSNDSSITGSSGKQGKGYNDFEEVINNTGYPASDDTLTNYITYDDIEDPEFAFRYCNPITTSYITSTTKQWYNGENLFEYTLNNNTLGKLDEKVDYFNGDGGYTLCGVDYSGKLLLSHELEANLYNNDTISVENEKDWWSDYNVNGVAFDNYINNVLRQRRTESCAKLYSVDITSVEQYETIENNMQNIQNISMLCPLQAPININGSTANDNIVSIIDLYVLVNTYKNLEGETVNWTVNTFGSADMNVCLYNNPYVYNSIADFKTGIENMTQNLDTSGNSEDNTVELQLQEVGGITYAIIGYLKSESNDFYNILAVRLHSATTQPMGWLTSFSYPYQTVDNAGTTLEYTQAFNGTKHYYDETRGNEVYTGDGYTITRGEADGHTYPIYNMTVPYIHSTDGSFSSNSYSRRITNSGNITFDFDVQNISKFRVDIIDEDGVVYRAVKDCPTTGISSTDGTVVIKANAGDVKGGSSSSNQLVFYKVINDEVSSTVLSMSYNNDENKNKNPFYKSGNKNIIVYGTTDDTFEEIVLFEININKTVSFENYIKNNELSRRWFGEENNSLYTEVEVPISLDNLLKNFLYDKGISVLADKSNDRVVYAQNRDRGNYTSYPDYVDNFIDITAEDGSTATYQYRKIFPDENIFNLSFINSTSSDYYTNCTLKNNTIIMSDYPDFMYTVVTDASKISQMNISTRPTYANNAKAEMEVEKFDIFVDGELVRTVSTPVNANYTHYGIYDSTWGIKVRVGLNSNSNNRRIIISKDNTVPKADLPDEPITIKPYVKYVLPDGQIARFEMTGSTFIKELNPDRQLLATSTSMTMSSSYISEFSNAEAVNVEYGSYNSSYSGYVINYNVDYTTLNHLYITDVVEPNCSSSTVTYAISPCATLEQYVNNEWVQVFAAQQDANVYTTNYNYDQSGLGSGYTYEYRIVAQDYTTEDPEKATHITYFTHSIGATTRNKTLTIEFKENDTTTTNLYNEIINKYGNLSIQVKNMNADQIKMQQTKFYVGALSLESNYYKISQGDYSILVNLPDEYDAKVKIVGGSSEGYLQDNPYVQGKRLRLPFANSQTIKLEVTLQIKDVQSTWGTVRYKSLCKEYNTNYV